jgi:ribosomal-protein-alanine N-acetyltransferase
VNVEIRLVRDSDFQELKDFFERNNQKQITRNFNPFPLNEKSASFICKSGKQDCYYVTISDGQVVGFCMLRGWDEGFSIPSFGILVDQHWQNRGIGREMTEFAISEALRMNCKMLRLSVYKSNSKASKLYLSLGFQEESSSDVVIDGEVDRKIIMMKQLGPNE